MVIQSRVMERDEFVDCRILSHPGLVPLHYLAEGSAFMVFGLKCMLGGTCPHPSRGMGVCLAQVGGVPTRYSRFLSGTIRATVFMFT